MNNVTHSLAMIALAYGVLLFESMVSTIFPLVPFTPNLLLPLVIFLGVSQDVHIVRGAFIAFATGYLFDLFCGNRLSLQTFICVAVFMISRGAGLRLFLRGPGFQVLLTFFVSLLSGGATLAIRAIFERSAPFPTGSTWSTVVTLVAPAISSGLAAPIVFALVQRVDSAAGRRREEATP